MSDTSKIFMLPDGAGTSNSLDPNLLFSMMNNNGFGGGGNWMWIIFLFFLYGWGGNGMFGGRGFGPDGDSSKELLMQALSGNGNAVSSLASQLNCDINSVRDALSNVQNAVQSVGNQVGMTGQQVINAVQQGNMAIGQQLSSCCCDIREAVTRGNYDNQIATLNQTNQLTENINKINSNLSTGFAGMNHENALQTCSINTNLQAQVQSLKDSNNANTLSILNRLDAMQTSALHEKINELQETKSSLQNQISQEQQNQAIAAMIAPLQAQINAVKAAQPSTTTVQYPQLTVIPNYVAGAYGPFNNPGLWA